MDSYVVQGESDENRVDYRVANSRGPESKAHKALNKSLGDVELDMSTLAKYMCYDSSPVMQARFFDLAMKVIAEMGKVAETEINDYREPHFNALQRARLISDFLKANNIKY